ncbi:MAG: ADP-ribosylglycohydrolase family protein [Defluviitaleaceae bacterium]|nr:ADP-ribosylglycohydrolase family protein [Defluviitaleaceae bacterium]
MLTNQPWIKLAPEMHLEWEQSEMEGRDVAHLKNLCTEIAANGNEEMAEQACRLLAAAPMRTDFTFTEPSCYEEIIKEAPPRTKVYTAPALDEGLKGKIKGAWVGRISGCLLGKPVEGWRRNKLWPMLKEAGNFPMTRYIGGYTEKLVQGAAPVDDDTNYTVFSMKLIERYGRDFTPDDVLEAWMSWIPFLAACTAERVAYRNAAMGLTAPQTATYKNPYREWIGAQIRGDFFGYINMGNPQKAAEMAWRDASISHVKNGIYGEMLIAAMIAIAAVCNDVREVIESALCEIPKNCRLRRDIDAVLDWHKKGFTEDEAIEKIHETYDEHTGMGWCHTNSNAMIVVMALLYGEKDFGKSICLSVQATFDTDCNGATVGSILGIMLGEKGIDPYWPTFFNYKLRTSVEGYHLVTVDELAEKTWALLVQ